MGFVIDASCALKLVLEDGGGPAYRVWHRRRLEENAAMVSSTLLPHEVGNVLVRRLSTLDAADVAATLERIVHRLRLVEPDPRTAMQHARGLTYYDAGYLAIAQAAGDTLVTSDAPLAAAAAKAGVAVLRF